MRCCSVTGTAIFIYNLRREEDGVGTALSLPIHCLSTAFLSFRLASLVTHTRNPKS